ncbi:MAG: helix-turn-helix domain-containing protein [Christensenellaceae bacterium]|jgi:transcriptional regulator with XRE-family HTH domain|nr:helix-turn-helix domain-containing protein [Christensenellaceae bacterium]
MAIRGKSFDFASKLHELRMSNKQSQSQLANILKVSQDTISLWELGKSYPDLKTFYEICKLYEVSADYLIGLREY